MKPITKNHTFVNETILEDFWIKRETQVKTLVGERIYQMGFGDLTVKKLILDQIAVTQEAIFLASYLLSDDEIISALKEISERNIRVYILTSNDALLDRERKKEPDENDQKIVNHHKSVLKTLSRTCLVRGSSHLHAKFIISDPLSQPQGILLTANITKEALTRNPELAVVLSGSEILELFEAFRHVFWNGSDQELKEQKWAKISNKPVPPLNDWKQVSSTINQNNNLETKLIELIERSTGELFIGSYKMSDDTRLYSSLTSYAENKKVTLFTRLHRSNQTVYAKLSKMENITLVASKFLHAKFIINDKGGIVTTANFNPQSFDDGFEVGISIDINDSTIKIMQNWKSNLEYLHTFESKIKNIKETILLKLAGDTNKFEHISIVESKMDQREINTDTIEEFIDWEDKEISPPNFNYEKQIEVKYTVHPPVIPIKAIKINKKNDIKNQKLVNSVEILFNKKEEPKYDLYINQDKAFVKVKSIKEYQKIKENIPTFVKIVF